jgi:hypothetical protein
METKIVKMDAQAVADVVTMAVKTATAPLVERLSASEQANLELRREVVMLRERLAATEVKVETKAQMELLERTNVDLRDRLLVLEAGTARHPADR